MEAVVCRECGAKIKAGRPICLRCGAALTFKTRARRWFINQGPRAFAGGASVALFFVGALLTLGTPVRPVPADTVAQPAAKAGSVATVSGAPTIAGPALSTEVEPEYSAADKAYEQGDFGTALRLFEKLIDKDPSQPHYHNNLGQVLVRVGRSGDALEHFTRAAELRPDEWSFRFNRARGLMLANRVEDAVAEYREAVRLFPNDYATRFNLGQALHSLGDEKAAVHEYLAAIAEQPNDAPTYFALGVSYDRLQQRAETIAAFTRYLELAPKSREETAVRRRLAELNQAVTAARNNTPSIP
jgi:Flp pilus assembly protein TadD